MKRFITPLSSLRLTLVLLLALAGLFLAGLVVPQKAVLQRELYEQWRSGSPNLVAVLEAIRLTDIYRSPIAFGLWGAFFLNLTVVMVRRVPMTLQRVRIDGAIPDPTDPGFTTRRAFAADRDGLAQVRTFFLERGFAVHSEGDRVRALRNRLAPLATLAFHLSFFIIAAGAMVSVVTRFEGEVDLGVGEQFTGALGQYVRPPRLPSYGRPPWTQFLLESVEPVVSGQTPTAVRMTLIDYYGFRQQFEINRPFRAHGMSFVFRNLGVAPLLVLTDAEGRERFAGFVRLNVLQGRKDTFTLLGQRFVAEFFPDHVPDESVVGTRSQEMRDPVFRFTVEAVSGRQATQSLHPGESMALGPYTLTWADWRYWVRLYVRAERGLELLWFGLGLGSVAVAWRLFRFRREYVAVWTADAGGGLLNVGARAEYYRALFEDEAMRTLSALGEALNRPPD